MAKKRTSSSSSHHIRILGFGQNEVGERFVRLRVDEGRGFLVSYHDWGPQKFAELNQRGAHLIDDTSKRDFTNRLQGDGPPGSTFTVATRIGWHGRHFVLPGRKIDRKARLKVHLDADNPALINKYRQGGTLKGWRELTRLARGNTRFMLVLAQAFVGPLGALLDVEQPSVQLFGSPGSCKTVLAIAAGSVWGRHRSLDLARRLGFGESWNKTVNATEPVAGAHNHTLLILDETRVGPAAKAVFETVMRLEGSVEKDRIGAAPARTWWVPLLSTSNLTLDELAIAAGERIDDAYRGRLIDVPVPAGGHGIFENLHGKPDLPTMAQAVLGVAAEHFGQAGLRYVERLERAVRKDPARLRRHLQRRRRQFLGYGADIVALNRDLGRIREKFATIYAAGRLAADYGLLQWPKKELRAALLACLQAHVDLVAGSTPNAPSAVELPLERLRAYVAEHRANFVDLRDRLVRDPKHDHGACPGYVATHKGERHYLFSHECLAAVVGSERAAKDLKVQLDRHGAIRTAGGGRDGARFAVKTPIYDQRSGKKPRAYVVVIRASFVDNPGSA